MKETKMKGQAEMQIPKKVKGPSGATLSNGGDMSKNMGCVTLKPTKNGKGKSGY